MPNNLAAEMAIPLANWADAQLQSIAREANCPAISALSAATLLGERAILNGFNIPGRVSAGGGCRFYDTRTGPLALTLARSDDRDLLAALFQQSSVDPSQLAVHFSRQCATDIVARGRLLGLATAGIDEAPPSPAFTITARGKQALPSSRPPLVIDLTALWAGPLAGHLLSLTGAQVIKVESRNRPDRMRDGDPALFARLNQSKANVAVDFSLPEDRDALLKLIRRADIVLEAARPRALLQLGIDADQMVRETSGLVWVTITGHGIAGDAANWIGFGDDCSVAGGLSAELLAATGTLGFGGDACADPLAGIYAARAATEQRAQGTAARMIISMSGVVAKALASERSIHPAKLRTTLRHWATNKGTPFPPVAMRDPGPVAALGADSATWLPC